MSQQPGSTPYRVASEKISRSVPRLPTPEKALDAKHDLSKKMAREGAGTEIIRQIVEGAIGIEDKSHGVAAILITKSIREKLN